MRIATRFHFIALVSWAALITLSTGCVSEIVRKVPSGAVDTAGDKTDVVVPDHFAETEVDEPDVVADLPHIDVEVVDEDVEGPEVLPDLTQVEVTVGQTAEVGPEGGTFTLEGGVTLVVPAGAVETNVTLSISPAPGQKPTGVTPVTNTWNGAPDGQQFELPVTLRLPMLDVEMDAGQWALVEGFVGEGTKFDSVPAWPDFGGQEVWVQTSNFSYVLAGLSPPPSTCMAHELCDGKDNDCDGAVDEASDLLKDDDVTGCASQGVCLLQVDAECVDGEWSCSFKTPDSPPLSFEEGTELSCDAKDNDCDGLVDEELVGKVEVLEGLGVLDVECLTDGICSKSDVVAACWKKTENSADWVCDYSGVEGFEGGNELTCDSADNDCDGEIDEGTCKLLDGCVEDAACVTGHCALPLGGAENSFCTGLSDSCLAVKEDASVVEVESGGTWCVEGLDHHRASCIDGVWEEPVDCAEEELVNPICDSNTMQCAGGCEDDEDCDIFEGECTGAFICDEQGECKEELATGPQCHKQNWVCQEFSCDPENGDCIAISVGEGLICDDGDLCTGSGECEAGACTGAPPKTCNDENGCTNDYCNPDTGGCIFDPAELTGAPCDDGSICTTNDVCQEDGSCTGQMKPCDDGNVCTADACDEEDGECKEVLTPGAPCDDGDLCTMPGTCNEGGQCILEPVDCNDDNDCTKDVCVFGDCEYSSVAPSTPCLYPTSAFGGQDVCIPLGLCDGDGTCQPGEDFCQCHEDEDCITNDDNLCNGTGTCEIGDGGLLFCEDQPGTIVVCDSSEDTQCLVNTCDVSTGFCSMQPLEAGTQCSDGDECTAEDQCIDGLCLGAVEVDCDDSNGCTNDLCDSDEGCISSPVAEGTPCEDGEPCTLADKCDADGECISGSPKFPACDDGEICTSDTCTIDGSGCLFEPILDCCASNAECNEAGGEICTFANVCCAPVCVGDEGQPFECGSDGCGSDCGTCGINAVCHDGACCYPNCYSPVKICGHDGCGGSCGACEPAEVCTEFYQCCVPNCVGKDCGPDDCGGTCGSCNAGFICEEESGECEFCEADCDGKSCGDDGCGDLCGVCEEGAKCLDDGTCCTPDCDGKECGDDGCGEMCATCLDWQACSPAGQCLCDDCCSIHDDCGPTELCGGMVQDGEDNFIICYEPNTLLNDGFESYNQGDAPDIFTYSYVDGVFPWVVKAGFAPFTTNSGARSFRYYLVGPDEGGYFAFRRHLPEVGEGELSKLSFLRRCTNELGEEESFTLTIRAGQADLLVMDNAFCDKQWHRHIVDLSPLSGPTELRFVVEKGPSAGAEIFIDDLAIFVSDCPDDIPCAELEAQDNACTVSSIDDGACFIDWACYADGDVNQSIECAKCDSITDKSNWTPDDALCDDENPATSDICDIKEGCYNNF